MIIQCRTVAELGHNYTTLDAAREALDERICRASTFDPAMPTLEPLHTLWIELEDVLSQQEAHTDSAGRHGGDDAGGAAHQGRRAGPLDAARARQSGRNPSGAEAGSVDRV